MTSGRARAQRWTLRFERRSAPYIEPLMGWTGDDDPLSQVELSVPVRRSRHRICAPPRSAILSGGLAGAGGEAAPDFGQSRR
ncbi:NADH dehydrogenase ubiquinone Fe-S protein 4 [Bradyrhizobium japonicum]